MIKVIIRDEPWSGMVGIAIFEEQNGKRYMAKNVELKFEEIKEEQSIAKPTLRLSYHIADEFLRGLANALSNNGIKTDNDHKIQGLLEAKNQHLEDMRKLVFNERKD